MNRTRVKICGLTRPEDAVAAVTAGADAIGLVFWQPSSRSVNVERAAEICQQLPAFVTVVALLVDAEPEFVRNLLDRLPIGLLQFHGSETPTDCDQFGKPYMKAIRVRPGLDISAEIERYPAASSILLDAYRKDVPGGTGETFEWQLIPPEYRSRIVLAGGLNPDNVGAAVRQVRPYAVDVSGGVERAPGIKHGEKIRAFIRQARLADEID